MTRDNSTEYSLRKATKRVQQLFEAPIKDKSGVSGYEITKTK